MIKDTKLIRVFISSFSNVNDLQLKLEKLGIYSVVEEDYKSGIKSGLIHKAPLLYNLFINKADFHVAEPIIKSYNQSLKQI